LFELHNLEQALLVWVPAMAVLWVIFILHEIASASRATANAQDRIIDLLSEILSKISN